MRLSKVFLWVLFVANANGSMLPDSVVTIEFNKIDFVASHIITGSVQLRGCPNSTLLFPYHVFKAIDPNCIKETNHIDRGSFIAYIESGHAMDVSGLTLAAGQYFTAHNIGDYSTLTSAIPLVVSERESKYKLSKQLTSAISQLFVSGRENKSTLFNVRCLAFELTERFREGDRTLGVLLSQAVINRIAEGDLEEMRESLNCFSKSRAVLNDIIENVHGIFVSLRGGKKEAEEQVNVVHLTNAIETLVATLQKRFREGNNFNNEERELGVLPARIKESKTLQEYLERLQQYFSPERSQAILNAVEKDDMTHEERKENA